MHHGLRLCSADIKDAARSPENLKNRSVRSGQGIRRLIVVTDETNGERQTGHANVLFDADRKAMERACRIFAMFVVLFVEILSTLKSTFREKLSNAISLNTNISPPLSMADVGAQKVQAAERARLAAGKPL